jgi:hypothetical protein
VNLVIRNIDGYVNLSVAFYTYTYRSLKAELYVINYVSLYCISYCMVLVYVIHVIMMEHTISYSEICYILI